MCLYILSLKIFSQSPLNLSLIFFPIYLQSQYNQASHNFQYFAMSNFFVINNNQGLHDKEINHTFSSGLKMREAYISPYKQPNPSSKEHNKCPTSPTKFSKNDNTRGNDTLPPRAVPFRRSSRNSSRERIEQTREQSSECRYSHKATDSEMKNQSIAKVKSLQKKVHQQAVEKQKWKSFSNTQQQQIKKIKADLIKIQEEKQSMSAEILNLKQALLLSEKNLLKANQSIENLNKNLKEYKINQKSLANLKNLQNQLDLLQQKNVKIIEENEQLSKNNKRIKNQLQKKDSTSQSQVDQSKKDQRIKSLQLQVKRLKEQLHKGKSQRQILLQTNLRQLQKKLYDKQNEIKKLSIQLNFIDRKKYISIDEVKTKKDQQIKDLRQRFMKVSKDLKQTKDKIEQTQKKKLPKERSPHPRRIKSSKLLGATSQSQEVTFELSSQI